MQKVPVMIILFLWLSSFILPVETTKEKIEWISFEEAEQRMKSAPRPVLIDVYTEWCGWCKVMDKKTYNHNKVAAYINTKYYAIKFDAESKTPVKWKGKTYQYEPQQRMHGLAVALLGADAGFPTTVFIPENPSTPQAIPGFLKPAEIHPLLTYFSEGHHQKIRFDKYAATFKSDW
jgi:thioredoxin-related protein